MNLLTAIGILLLLIATVSSSAVNLTANLTYGETWSNSAINITLAAPASENNSIYLMNLQNLEQQKQIQMYKAMQATQPISIMMLLFALGVAVVTIAMYAMNKNSITNYIAPFYSNLSPSQEEGIEVKDMVTLSDGGYSDNKFTQCDYCKCKNNSDREMCHGCGAPLKG